MCDVCEVETAKYKTALAEFERQYPKYCRKCGGQGYIEYSYDPSPAGVSLSPGRMYDTEPCIECTERGVCPLCTRPLTRDSDNRTCGCPENIYAPSPPDFECPQLIEQNRIYWQEVERGIKQR